MTFFNVGANKGYAVHGFLSRYASHWFDVTPREWHDALLATQPSLWRACGVCSACKAAPPKAVFEVPDVRVHAFEFMSENVKILRRMFEKFSVPGLVHHRVVSNTDGVTHNEPGIDVLAGDERWGLHMMEKTIVNRTVRTIRLDTFCAKRNIHRITHLSIDAEGNDPLVVEGTSRMLKERRIDLLEFEYHGQGAWTERTLRDVLHDLYGWGYECFWQGVYGRVAPASDVFWSDDFEFRRWSNLVCSHLSPVLVQLYKLSIVGADMERPQDRT
jgi:FkbM family methyltransferase